MGKPCRRSGGLKACTRDLFSKKFGEKKYNPPLTTFLRNYKVGDMVDIVAQSSQQKGMPHKFYHGRTGKIWNVTKRAVGVEVRCAPLLALPALACCWSCCAGVAAALSELSPRAPSCVCRR